MSYISFFFSFLFLFFFFGFVASPPPLFHHTSIFNTKTHTHTHTHSTSPRICQFLHTYTRDTTHIVTQHALSCFFLFFGQFCFSFFFSISTTSRTDRTFLSPKNLCVFIYSCLSQSCLCFCSRLFLFILFLYSIFISRCRCAIVSSKSRSSVRFSSSQLSLPLSVVSGTYAFILSFTFLFLSLFVNTQLSWAFNILFFPFFLLNKKSPQTTVVGDIVCWLI